MVGWQNMVGWRSNQDQHEDFTAGSSVHSRPVRGGRGRVPTAAGPGSRLSCSGLAGVGQLLLVCAPDVTGATHGWGCMGRQWTGSTVKPWVESLKESKIRNFLLRNSHRNVHELCL